MDLPDQFVVDLLQNNLYKPENWLFTSSNVITLSDIFINRVRLNFLLSMQSALLLPARYILTNWKDEQIFQIFIDLSTSKSSLVANN